MNKRPLAITLVALLYIATGAGGMVSHLNDMRQHPFEADMLWASLVALIAIVAGIYLYRGSNWARWLALAWIIFHVILSAFNSWSEMLIHALLCAVITYFLFRPASDQYFNGSKPQTLRS
jgi:hypothetical protein